MERFQREGTLEFFDDKEAIQFLLEIARCPGNHEHLSNILIDEFGNMKSVLEAREEQLTRIKGIGDRTATTIRMILPFIRMWARINSGNSDYIRNSSEAETYCKSLLMGLRVEWFYVICLNAKCGVLGERRISEGNLSEVNAYPRIIMETALNYNAHSVILTHNHPGGTLLPSSEDISSTRLIQRLLNGVGILVLDHILVAGTQTYSMIQHGDIDYRAS